LQPDGRQFRTELPADGREGYLYSDRLGGRRAEALGRDRQAAKEPRRPHPGAGGFQRLGQGKRPAAVPDQPDPGDVARGLSISREARMAMTTRRTVLSGAAATVLATPFVRGAHAAGSLAVGFWDHWVPGAN